MVHRFAGANANLSLDRRRCTAASLPDAGKLKVETYELIWSWQHSSNEVRTGSPMVRVCTAALLGDNPSP